MTNAATSSPPNSDARTGGALGFDALPWIEYGATAMALAVLAQATLAGQIVSGDYAFVTAHRVLGEVLPLLALALALLPWGHRRPARHAGMALWLGVGGVLVMAQTGLGFVGRESAMALAIHVPVGVAILGVYVGCAVKARAERTRP